jgi:hypothetical protein
MKELTINYYDLVAAGGVYTQFNVAMIEVLYSLFKTKGERVDIHLFFEFEHNVIVYDILSKDNLKIIPHPYRLINKSCRNLKTPIKNLLSIFYVIIGAVHYCELNGYIKQKMERIFLIYNCKDISDIDNFIKMWQNLANCNKLPLFFFVGCASNLQILVEKHKEM